MAQAVEHLPIKSKALSSNPSEAKKNSYSDLHSAIFKIF
jgi:hypothetical protein